VFQPLNLSIDDFSKYDSNKNNSFSSIRISIDDKLSFTSFIKSYCISACIISSTSIIPDWIKSELELCNINNIYTFDSSTPIPITNSYKTPLTLGTDRLASVIGGYFEAGRSHPVLCIDFGTAITYDFISSDGNYIGGNISPGLSMRFKSLHLYTKKLPLVDKEGDCPIIGYSTDTAIRSGVINGIKQEINGYIEMYQQKYSNIYIFFTGGNYLDFDYPSKKRIFAEQNLVLKGLNITLNHILLKK